MNYMNLIVGPHLIGLLFIVIGLMQLYFPPKKINNWYGYRTQTARQNQKTWDEGNRYSARYMIRIGIVFLVLGIIINALSILLITDDRMQTFIKFFLLFGGAMGIGIMTTIETERHLALKFKKKGK
jgi:uncharacterized membrane protein